MEHIAIDLGGMESQICARSATGEIILETKWRTRLLGKWLETRPPSRVIVETCAEAFTVADWALAAGHEVRVVPGHLVRSLGVGARGVKTDKRDARALSETSCLIDLPSVHVPSHQARARKELCTARESLLRARTQLVNCTRGLMRRQTRMLRRGTVATFPRRVRNTYKEVPGHIEQLLASIEALTEQIGAADAELRKLAETDPVCQRLMTIPGVGPVTSLRFAAAIDEVHRFGNAHQVESYLGLVPGERQSGARGHRTSITKAGAAAVRRTLVQAALSAKRTRRSEPMVLWALEVERRRGKQIATVALARKMAGIMYALMRDGTTYQAVRAAQPPQAAQAVQALGQEAAA